MSDNHGIKINVIIKKMNILVMYILKIKSEIRAYRFYVGYRHNMTASVAWWSEFLATDPEEPGSIPSVTKFSEK
jgi:hypothetical protein